MNIEVPEGVKRLLAEREKVREAKDFTKSDELRREIERSGWVVNDTPNGVKLIKKF